MEKSIKTAIGSVVQRSPNHLYSPSHSLIIPPLCFCISFQLLYLQMLQHHFPWITTRLKSKILVCRRYQPLPSSPIMCPHPPHVMVVPSVFINNPLLPVPAINTIPQLSRAVLRLPSVSELTKHSFDRFGWFRSTMSARRRFVTSSSHPLRLSA